MKIIVNNHYYIIRKKKINSFRKGNNNKRRFFLIKTFFRLQINEHNVNLNLNLKLKLKLKLKILVHILMFIHQENELFIMLNVLVKIYHKVNSFFLLLFNFYIKYNKNSCSTSIGYSSN